jgi:hypothetical protein
MDPLLSHCKSAIAASRHWVRTFQAPPKGRDAFSSPSLTTVTRTDTRTTAVTTRRSWSTKEAEATQARPQKHRKAAAAGLLLKVHACKTRDARGMHTISYHD